MCTFKMFSLLQSEARSSVAPGKKYRRVEEEKIIKEREKTLHVEDKGS